MLVYNIAPHLYVLGFAALFGYNNTHIIEIDDTGDTDNIDQE